MKNTGGINMKITIKYGYDECEEIKKLFLEYTDMLVENDSNFAEYLLE